MMFCLQSQRYIVQQLKKKYGHTLGKKIDQYHTYIAFSHTLPKHQMSPFNSTYFTQNYHSKYIERSFGKARLSNQ